MTALAGWRQHLDRITTTADNAVSGIRPGSRLFVGHCCGEPQTLVDALLRHPGVLAGTRAYQVINRSSERLAGRGLAPGYQLVAVVSSPRAADAIAAGEGDALLTSIWTMDRWLEEGLIELDVALIQTSPPDAHGFCSLGINVSFTPTACRCARQVIAEMNDRMPRTLGDCSIHVSEIDQAVRTSRALLETPPSTVTATDREIGRHVAGLIDDGSILQIGVGSVPDAVLSYLEDRRDLGIHSGALTDAVVPLIEHGVVTNRRKPIDRGKSVAGQLFGTRRLYEFAHDNPAIAMRPASYTHNPAVLSRLEGLVALNSALQVDLRGQCNLETLHGRQVSSVGGAADFVRGANLAPKGKVIVALQSTAGDGRHSRIVARLDRDPQVSLHALDVHYVATEYGVASLRGKTLRERAAALIAVAHPSFREALARAAASMA